MTNNDAMKLGGILSRMQSVFRDVFDDDSLTVTENTSAADIPDWDSLAHISLCVALEQEFKTRLNPVEMAALTDVGKLARVLAEQGRHE